MQVRVTIKGKSMTGQVILPRRAWLGICLALGAFLSHVAATYVQLENLKIRLAACESRLNGSQLPGGSR